MCGRGPATDSRPSKLGRGTPTVIPHGELAMIEFRLGHPPIFVE